MNTLQLAFIYMAPWLTLMLALLAGRYPGERVICRLASRKRRVRRAHPRPVPPPSCPFNAHLGGGLLLACRLAGRGPP